MSRSVGPDFDFLNFVALPLSSFITSSVSLSFSTLWVSVVSLPSRPFMMILRSLPETVYLPSKENSLLSGSFTVTTSFPSLVNSRVAPFLMASSVSVTSHVPTILPFSIFLSPASRLAVHVPGEVAVLGLPLHGVLSIVPV